MNLGLLLAGSNTQLSAMKQRFHRDTNEVIASLCACNGSASNNQKSELEIAEYLKKENYLFSVQEMKKILHFCTEIGFYPISHTENQ